MLTSFPCVSYVRPHDMMNRALAMAPPLSRAVGCSRVLAVRALGFAPIEPRDYRFRILPRRICEFRREYDFARTGVKGPCGARPGSAERAPGGGNGAPAHEDGGGHPSHSHAPRPMTHSRSL